MISVLSLNFAISEFIARFSGALPDVRNWPRIHLPTRGERIHPLVIDMNVVKEIFNTEELQMPGNQVYKKKRNSKDLAGHLIYNSRAGDEKTVSRSGDGSDSDCCITSNEELPIPYFRCVETVRRSGDEKRFRTFSTYRDQVEALAIDRHDNVFVVTSLEVKRDTLAFLSMFLSLLTCCLLGCSDVHICRGYVLHVYDSCGNFQHTVQLKFLESEAHKTLNCVVNNDIFIHKDRENKVYICDSNGHLKSRS